jgi:hypothetical protein
MKTLVSIFTLISAGAVAAAVRESGSCTVLAEAEAPGRARLSSAHFAADTACSPAGGVAQSAHFTARFGFAGQLYDVTGGTVTANPSSVPETSAAQLSVSVALDDGTTLPGAQAGPVVWEVVSGPVVSISSSGLATTGAVWEDTIAVVRANVAGIKIDGPVTVSNTIQDNFGPIAGDGLPDTWQFEHFDIDDDGDLDLPAGPNADADADGADNLGEWTAGTDPTDANDLLRLEALGMTPEGFHFRFGPVFANRDYIVLTRPDPAAPLEKFYTLEATEDAEWHEATVPLSFGIRGFFSLSVEVK